MTSTRTLRRLVAERADQVAIGTGEDELAAALSNVLDLLDQAASGGRGSVGVDEVIAAVHRGLD